MEKTTGRKIKFVDAVFILAILLCIIAICIAQYVISTTSAATSVDVGLFTTRHSITFSGIVVRNETVIPSPVEGGVVSYSVDNGGRIIKDTEIARIYGSSDQIYYRNRIEQLEEELKTLEESQNKGTTEYVQPEFIFDQINEQYKNQLIGVKSGDLNKLYDNKLNLLKLMCIYNISVNAEIDYSQRIQQIKSEISSLKQNLADPISVVKSSGSGYFTSAVDGYEGIISLKSIGSISADTVKQVVENPDVHSGNYIGKTFDDYKWKFVGVIDTPDIFFVNTNQTMYFYSSGKSYKVHIDSVIPTGNGNEAVVTISCDKMDESIAKIRADSVELLFGEYTGIRVPRAAIRFVNGEKGVYISEGEKLVYKKLDVIYEGEDYVLSKLTQDSDYVNLYDRVLLEAVSADEVIS